MTSVPVEYWLINAFAVNSSFYLVVCFLSFTSFYLANLIPYSEDLIQKLKCNGYFVTFPDSPRQLVTPTTGLSYLSSRL